MMERMVENQPAGDANGEGHESRGHKEEELVEDQGARQLMFEEGIASQPVGYASHYLGSRYYVGGDDGHGQGGCAGGMH
jgi:hypothetical protein